MTEYIDRKKALHNIAHADSQYDAFKRVYQMTVKSIQKSDEPKHGVWIDLDSCMSFCSECNGLGCWSKFCPNCGALMDNAEV